MDAALHNIGSQFGRCSFQHPADGFDNGFAGIFYGFICLLGRELDRTGRGVQLIDTADMNRTGFVQG